MLKSANYKKEHFKAKQICAKTIKSAQARRKGKFTTKKAKNAKRKGKKQNINKRRIYKVEYKTKTNLKQNTKKRQKKQL